MPIFGHVIDYVMKTSFLEETMWVHKSVTSQENGRLSLRSSNTV